MKTLWFNQCFSTIYYTIEKFKQMYGDEIKIIGTSTNAEHVFKMACDEFYTEPDIYGDDYYKWAMKFCKEHNIQYFFAKKHRETLSRHINSFKAAGVTVVIDDYTIQYAFVNKHTVYEKVSKETDKVKIPDYKIAYNPDEFANIIDEMLYKYDDGKACYKFDNDEGGGSFRILSNNVHNDVMYSMPSLAVGHDEAIRQVNLAAKAGLFKPVMIMEYLAGPEISCDCYNSKNGFVCTPRRKLNTRQEIIESMPEVKELCLELQQIFGFKYPWNVQFRHDTKTGELRLLEINTRLSGGSHLGMLADAWVGEPLIKDLFGETDYTVQDPKKVILGRLERHIVMEHE